MLRYGDHYPDVEDRQPDCYGRDDYFTPSTADCQRCDFFSSCAEIVRNRRGSRRSPISPSRSPRAAGRSEFSGVEIQQPQEIQEGRTAAQQLLANVATGAARGGSWELYQFFCWYRF